MAEREGNGPVAPSAMVTTPQPTLAYSERQAEARLLARGVRVTQLMPIVAPVTDTAAAPLPPPIPIPTPIPVPLQNGARVLVYKQDPSVGEIGIRKAFLPSRVFAGPRDARIAVTGLPVVTPNVFGDLIVDPVANPDGFDAVHTFAVVRMTLTMFQRALGIPVAWQWNTGGNTQALSVFPHAGVTQNAFYSRSAKALKFFFFDAGSPPKTIFTCRSLDIVAHECGHAVLDALKPGWLGSGNPPQTGGLHESWGDMTAIFLALSQLDQCEAIIAQTKASLHAKNFLSDLAEQFGLALGRPNGLRNADNDLKLSEVGTEVHAISQVMTGGVFDVLADIFALERRPAQRDDAVVLHDVGAYVASLVMRAYRNAPAAAATYANVVNNMLSLVASDGKPVQYRQSIVNRFSFREVVAPTAMSFSAKEDMELDAAIVDDPDATQDRSACCGTMQNDEYLEEITGLDDEIDALAKEFS